MPHTLELGRRVELVSMDTHHQDITIALYQQQRGGASEYLIHTYSSKPGVLDRIEFLRLAAATLGGMQRVGDRLRFTCGAPHLAAARRLFLEVCKLPTNPETVYPRPLHVFDKKCNAEVHVQQPNGAVGFSIRAETADNARLDAIAAGLKKLGQLNDQLAFDCGLPHPELLGLLLPRALNVRAILREEEMASTRGVLAPPSAQK